MELDVTAGEQVKAGLVEAALCTGGKKKKNYVSKAIESSTNGEEGVLLGTAKRSRSFRLAEMSETI